MHYISLSLWLLLAMVFSTSASPGINHNRRARRATPSDPAKQLLEGQLQSLTVFKSTNQSPLINGAIESLEQILRGSSCPEPFQSIGGCCYHFSLNQFSLPIVTRQDAATTCQDFGKRKNLNVNLAEVGVAYCDDAALMEHIGRQGADYANMWFGAKRNTNDNNWTWQQTKRDFSVNSNMWWSLSPADHADANCLAAFPVAANTVAPRAYFANSLCTLKFQYVCQIFY